MQFSTVRSDKERTLPEMKAYIADLMAFIDQNREMLIPLLAAQLVVGEQVEGVGGVARLSAYFRLGSEYLVRNTPGLTKERSDNLVRVSLAAVLSIVLFHDWLFSADRASGLNLMAALADFSLNGLDVRG